MSNSRGRCFRDRKRTARRKARQAANFAELMRRFPDTGVPTRFGGALIPTLDMLDSVGKMTLAAFAARRFKP